MTGASFSSMTSTEITTREIFSVVRGGSYRVHIYLLLPTSHELIHWLIPVGICIDIYNFDVDYDVSMLFP